MINGLLILLGCQLVGEALSHYLTLPIPGPVIGMIILLIALLIRKGPSKELDETATTFVKYIGFLFVPAGAGIAVYLGLIADQWLMLVLATFVSTGLSLILTALVFRLFARKTDEV